MHVGLNLGDFLFVLKCGNYVSSISLEYGTDNIMLNQLYQCNKEENHYWYQSIKYLLCINGLGNIWYSHQWVIHTVLNEMVIY